MNAWLVQTCSDFFGRCVPSAFVFALLDFLVSQCFKIAFLGRSSISLKGGRFNG